MTDINPTSVASQFATAYIQPLQNRLTSQTKSVQSVSNALSKLRSALQAFDSVLGTLSGKKGMQASSAAFSSTAYGTVTASASAQPGTYSLFVEQIASAHQLACRNLPSVDLGAGSAGDLSIALAGGGSFTVALDAADSDGDGSLTPAETARAINQAAGNGGQVNAMLATVNGQSQLILSSTATGAASRITLDTSAVLDGALKTSLDAGSELVPAQDAVVWLGAQGSGVKLQQAGNTFTAIPGISMSFTQAMTAGQAPITLTIANDQSGTVANVNSFIDAYNTLNKALGQLTDTGSADSGTPAAAFASDAGVRAMQSRLNTLLHQQVGGLRLLDFGIAMDRNGNLVLDQKKLEQGLVAHPGSLDTLFGNTGITTSSGVLGSLDKYLNSWLNVTNGQIKRRQDSVQNRQKALGTRQAQIEQQYSRVYERYLKQFTRLQQLQTQMSKTSDMFATAGAN